MSWKELIPNNKSALTQVFGSLRSRNYRLYFTGQCISLIGTWMQQVAMSWLIYRLTGSVLLLGTVAFINQIPSFLISIFAGVITDRFERRRILLITQGLFMFAALSTATLVLTGLIQVWQIMVFSLFAGIVTAFDAPTRQSMVVEMVDRKEDLSNAIALNSAIFNAARLIGPSVAGMLIALVGEGYCLLIDGISYTAVIGALLMMRMPEHPKKEKQEKILSGFVNGFRYCYGYLPIRILLIMVALISLFGLQFIVLVPAFAKDVLSGDSHTQGFILSSIGAGALTGAIYLAARKSVLGLGKVVSITGVLLGIGMIAVSFMTLHWMVFALLVPTGFAMITALASCNTLLQTLTDDDKRGRVMGFYAMAMVGMAPFGSLFYGSVAKWIGVQHALLVGGCLCVVGALCFEHWRPVIRRLARRVQVQQGIVPEIAKGINID
ncbi:MAG: MFS transporter [Bacteroidetes bacterium]|nr:MFS transporter [Bacteroidota bacterium]